MITFHQTTLLMTNNFLQTQQQVMLAYLQSKSALIAHSSGCVPIPAQQPAPVEPVSFTNESRVESAALAPPKEPVSDGAVAARASSNATHAKEEVGKQPSTSSTNTGEPCPNKADLPKSADELISSFIDLVSERTGYPAEMLDPALDLESDLGIDSIKRVEILSNFRRLLPEEMQEKFEGDLEELGTLRTLQAISDWIRKIPIPAQS